MDLLRKYLLSTAVLRSPDEPAAPVADPPAGDPPPAADPPAPAEPPAVDPPAPAVEAGNKPPKWALERISAETARREESERARVAAENRARDAEALAARLQAGGGDAPAAPPAAPAAQPDIDTLVNQRAEAMRLKEDSSAILAAGVNKFGVGFNETLSVLRAVDAVNDDIVLDLVAIDKANAHEILTQLAKDPEKAAAFAKLDSRRRIAELTRMSDAQKVAPAADPKAPAAKTVSKAPPPAPPVEPSASKVVDWRSDDASDEDFTAGFNKRMAERAALRR